MTTRLIKVLVILSLIGLMTGCKLAIMVPSGGDVTSESQKRNCAGGSLCEHNITDSTFNESFTAIARPGYVFSKWNKGAGFLCGDSTNPTCVISNVGTAGNAAIEGIIATGQYFYAMPLFEFVGIDTDGDGVKDHVDTDDDNDGVLDVNDNCPLEGPNLDGFGCRGNNPDIVIVNGRAWYQPDLFTGLLLQDIDDVCPSGVCAGTLKGHDMTGWHWAETADVAALFNSYGMNLGTGSGQEFTNQDGAIGIAFFAQEAGWRFTEQVQAITDYTGIGDPQATFYETYLLSGWIRSDSYLVSVSYIKSARQSVCDVSPSPLTVTNCVATWSGTDVGVGTNAFANPPPYPIYGGWFYKD
jgi:hypothetical protein